MSKPNESQQTTRLYGIILQICLLHTCIFNSTINIGSYWNSFPRKEFFFFHLQYSKEDPLVMLPLRSSFLLRTASTQQVCFISLLFLYCLHILNNEEQRPRGILQCNNANNQVRQKVTSNACTFITKTCESEDFLTINFLKRCSFLCLWYNSQVFTRTAHACETSLFLFYINSPGFPARKWKSSRPAGMRLERGEWQKTWAFYCWFRPQELWHQVW